MDVMGRLERYMMKRLLRRMVRMPHGAQETETKDCLPAFGTISAATGITLMNATGAIMVVANESTMRAGL